MNVIVICIDSLRQDHVSFYGGASPVATPGIDALARESVVFDHMYPEALPTIPIRTQLMTGQRTLPYRPWQPLTAGDRTMAEILGRYDYTSGLITDVYHYFKPGYNFHRGFHHWQWVRGQEYDPYRSTPLRRLKLEDHIKPTFSPAWIRCVDLALRNIEPFETAADHYAAKVFGLAGAWARDHRTTNDHRTTDKVFLWVDSFDPHEPWTPPREFDHFTDPRYQGKRFILPPGGRASDHFSAEEIASIRGLYAGEVAYVDHYVEQFLHTLREQGYFEDSLILLLADHGHPLADHGKFLKGSDRLYNELLKVPFMIRFPRGEYGGRRVKALGQFHDVLPTILDALGLANDTEALAGRSLMPVIRGERDHARESIVTGYHEGIDRCVRDETWSYISRPPGEPDELYNLIEDPRERRNLIDEQPEEARRLARAFGKLYALTGRAVKGAQGRDEIAGTAAG
ncbi:MAG: sulfatase [Chloroflexota bacterium]